MAGISAVEVVVTITSRRSNVLWVYTGTITELVLKGYIQFQNRQQKSYTLYFFCPLTITSHHQESQITQLSCIYIPPQSWRHYWGGIIKTQEQKCCLKTPMQYF